MHRRIINHDHARLCQLCAVGIKAVNDEFRIDRALGQVRLKITAQVEKSKHVQARRRSAWQCQCLPRRLPGVRNAGRQREAGFIKVNQIEIIAAVSANLAPLGQMLLRPAKVLFIAHCFQTAAHSLPGVACCFERSFERVAAEAFAQFFFNLLTGSFQTARGLGYDVECFF